MTLVSEKCSLPEVVRRIGRLEVRARYIVEGFLSGLHRSPYHGQSVEFREHRAYTAGDDLRHVDWKVWAKQDRLFVKRFEEDTNFRCTLVTDVSASMRYGRQALTKLEYAATAAAAVAYLLLRQHDAVGCVTVDDQVRTRLPYRSHRGHLSSICDSVLTHSTEMKTDLAAVLQSVVKTVPPRGVVVLLSDLLVEVGPLVGALRLLRQQGHDILVFHILDDDELDFPFSGSTRFEGLETAEQLQCNPKALRDGYLKALNDYLTRLARGCRAIGVDYCLTRTSDPFDKALTEVLNLRRLTPRSSR